MVLNAKLAALISIFKIVYCIYVPVPAISCSIWYLYVNPTIKMALKNAKLAIHTYTYIHIYIYFHAGRIVKQIPTKFYKEIYYFSVNIPYQKTLH